MAAKPARLVVIGASAGGVAALRTLLSSLKSGFAAAIAIVLHTRDSDVSSLAQLLGRGCPLPVQEAVAGARLESGIAYLAPGNYHLLIERDGRLALSVDERVCYVRPSADVLFESAVDAYGAATIGVVLTGTNADGAQGLAAIRAAGGLGLVQDPQDAEEPAMPEAAIRIAGADAVLPLPALAERLNRECLT